MWIHGCKVFILKYFAGYSERAHTCRGVCWRREGPVQWWRTLWGIQTPDDQESPSLAWGGLLPRQYRRGGYNPGGDSHATEPQTTISWGLSWHGLQESCAYCSVSLFSIPVVYAISERGSRIWNLLTYFNLLQWTHTGNSRCRPMHYSLLQPPEEVQECYTICRKYRSSSSSQGSEEIYWPQHNRHCLDDQDGLSHTIPWWEKHRLCWNWQAYYLRRDRGIPVSVPSRRRVPAGNQYARSRGSKNMVSVWYAMFRFLNCTNSVFLFIIIMQLCLHFKGSLCPPSITKLSATFSWKLDYLFLRQCAHPSFSTKASLLTREQSLQKAFQCTL